MLFARNLEQKEQLLSGYSLWPIAAISKLRDEHVRNFSIISSLIGRLSNALSILDSYTLSDLTKQEPLHASIKIRTVYDEHQLRSHLILAQSDV
jgi:hypothetical protein